MSERRVEWCEHIQSFDEIQTSTSFFSLMSKGVPVFSFINNWKQCPICLAPRPNELELWNKFSEYFQYGLSEEKSRGLAEIATKHYFPEGIEEELAKVIMDSRHGKIDSCLEQAKAALQFMRERK